MTACRPWCTGHFSHLNAAGTEQVEICAATPISLFFSHIGDEEELLTCYNAAADLTESPDGQSIMLHVNQAPVVELGPRQAAAIGAALLAKAAQALGDLESADYYRGMSVINADTAARSLR